MEESFSYPASRDHLNSLVVAPSSQAGNEHLQISLTSATIRTSPSLTNLAFLF